MTVVPHVVMLVANDVATDTRVKKEALALAHSGLRVTVVGVSSADHPSDSWLGPVQIVRVPVEFAIRDETRRRREDAVGRAVRSSDLTARIDARAKASLSWSRLAPEHRSPGAGGSVRYVASAAGRSAERALLSVARLLVGPYVVLRRLARRATGLRRHLLRRRLRKGPVRWRDEHPEILDHEVALGPVIDRLEPDVLHAHDMHVVGIAAHARARARRRGRNLQWVYDAHEYVPGLSQYGGRTARVIEGWADLEGEFIGDADAVITVSPAIADALAEHYGLRRHPDVVLNIPTSDPGAEGHVVPLREVCGIADGVPLLCYSGGVTRARGVHTAIEAMQELPEAHLAVVCVPHNDTWFARQLRDQVTELGLEDRVHLVNPVGPGEVVHFLRGVDVGLIPGLSFPSHEMSLPNKLFEYLHAGVPVVSSELDSLGEFLRRTGAGVTFPIEDAAGLAAAVRSVLAEHGRYSAAASDPELLTTYSWSRQAERLADVYRELLGELPARDLHQEDVLDLSETI